VAVDGPGNVYIADSGNGRIRKVSSGGQISTIASVDAPGKPRGVSIDSAGNLYFTDAAQHRVRKVAGDGAVTVVAGTGTCCYAGDDGPAANAQLNSPWGTALDPAGNIFVADTGNDAIRLLYSGSSTSFIRSVANAASNLLGGIAPGEMVSVYGVGFPSPA